MTESSPQVLRRPIFVLGCHKSGSTLVCCLLDGHKDLFVLPLEMHLLRYSGYWMNYPLQRDLPSMRSREARIAETLRNVRRANRSGQNYGMGRLDGRVDIDAFERRLRSQEWSDDGEFIQAAVSAAHVGLTGQPLSPGIRAVEKSVENAARAKDLHKLMPDCSFIHIVRNP
jgi:hypothetical protein